MSGLAMMMTWTSTHTAATRRLTHSLQNVLKVQPWQEMQSMFGNDDKVFQASESPQLLLWDLRGMLVRRLAGWGKAFLLGLVTLRARLPPLHGPSSPPYTGRGKEMSRQEDVMPIWRRGFVDNSSFKAWTYLKTKSQQNLPKKSQQNSFVVSLCFFVCRLSLISLNNQTILNRCSFMRKETNLAMHPPILPKPPTPQKVGKSNKRH